MLSDMIVLLTDVHAAGLCHKGGRKVAKKIGLDWHTLRKKGLPIETVASFDRPECRKVCAKTRERYARIEKETDNG